MPSLTEKEIEINFCVEGIVIINQNYEELNSKLIDMIRLELLMKIVLKLVV